MLRYILELSLRKSTINLGFSSRHTKNSGEAAGEGFPNSTSSTTPMTLRGSRKPCIALQSFVDIGRHSAKDLKEPETVATDEEVVTTTSSKRTIRSKGSKRNRHVEDAEREILLRNQNVIFSPIYE